ncbi:ComF family protein [Sporolactobacillus shoreae]|uniref:ComF family protein n=1 Tax=Sporolactobacillus shoreae TaxID=1465501 RepID=UPI001F4F51F4|nr:phosphoribosyltransferase family protein [Sporolactobacillus shoreae]
MNGLVCLICGQDRQERMTFRTLLSADSSPGFCRTCREKFVKIPQGHSCRLCGRDLGLMDEKFISGSVCTDCRRWEKSGGNGCFGRNIALYSYNDWMKEVITTFKFRGDAALAVGFRKEFRAAGRKIIGKDWRTHWERLRNGKHHPRETCVIVPMPLSGNRLKERGFNQAEVLAELIGEPVVPALCRIGGERKQSKKNRRERLESGENPFKLDEAFSEVLHGTKVLLIDDIYTTGATLRRAAAAFERADPKCVDSLTLIHG